MVSKLKMNCLICSKEHEICQVQFMMQSREEMMLCAIVYCAI